MVFFRWVIVDVFLNCWIENLIRIVLRSKGKRICMSHFKVHDDKYISWYGSPRTDGEVQYGLNAPVHVHTYFTYDKTMQSQNDRERKPPSMNASLCGVLGRSQCLLFAALWYNYLWYSVSFSCFVILLSLTVIDLPPRCDSYSFRYHDDCESCLSVPKLQQRFC